VVLAGLDTPADPVILDIQVDLEDQETHSLLVHHPLLGYLEDLEAPEDLVSPVSLEYPEDLGDLGGLDTHILLVHHLLLRYREDPGVLVALVFPVFLGALVLLPLVAL
jgi:hypothetical protein